MLYTVKQASIKLNVSMQSIYVKIKFPEFKDKTTKKQGKTYIDDATLMLIKDSLKVSNDDLNCINDDLNHVNENTSSNETATDSDDSSIMIKTLIEQLKVKDEQIKESNERLKQAHKLIENNQVLLQAKPQQDVLQLEEHFQTLDNKLIEIKDKMQKKDQDHRGIFQKIFKK